MDKHTEKLMADVLDETPERHLTDEDIDDMYFQYSNGVCPDRDYEADTYAIDLNTYYRPEKLKSPPDGDIW